MATKKASAESGEVLYTLRDNNLFVKGLGTLTKDPKNITALSQEHLDAIFKVAADNKISKEQAIKKYLVRLRVKEKEEVIPVEAVETLEVDNEE